MSDTTDWHSRIVGYGAVVVAALALYYAHLSYEHQVEQVEYSRATRLEVVASIVRDSVHFGVDPNGTILLLESGSMYCGVSLYAWVKIYNGSQHAVTIDTLIGFYAGKCTNDFPSNCQVASKCLSCVGRPACSFPLKLEPNEQAKMMITIPWVTSDYAFKRIGAFGKGIDLSPAQVVANLDTSFMEPYFYGQVWAPHIPTLLASNVLVDSIRCFKIWETTSTEHSLVVQVRLGSGEILTYRDYLPESIVYVVGGNARIDVGENPTPTVTVDTVEG